MAHDFLDQNEMPGLMYLRKKVEYSTITLWLIDRLMFSIAARTRAATQGSSYCRMSSHVGPL